MSNKELMLSPAVLLEAMQSKERVRRRLKAMIRAHEEVMSDMDVPHEKPADMSSLKGFRGPLSGEGQLVFN